MPTNPTATSLLRGAAVLALLSLLPGAGCGSKNTDKKADDSPAVARSSAPERGRTMMPSSRPRPRLAAPESGDNTAGDPPRLPDRHDDGARRQRFEEMRAQYDKNGDGTLDQDERTAMRTDRLHRSVETIDSDGDGKISRDEAASAPRRMGRMLRDFEAVDADGDGYVFDRRARQGDEPAARPRRLPPPPAQRRPGGTGRRRFQTVTHPTETAVHIPRRNE